MPLPPPSHTRHRTCDLSQGEKETLATQTPSEETQPSLGAHHLEIRGDVRSCGAWAGTLQRLQHPMSVVEGPRAQEREGEAGVPQALLRGRLARYRQRQRRRGRHVHVEPLQEGPGHAAESQL